MEGPHPAAAEATAQEAREGRSDAESFAVAHPDVVHRATDQLLRERGRT